MCLAVPGRVEEVFDKNGIRMGRLDFGGIKKEVCLQFLPELDVGGYALVHVGFAISQIDEESARKTLETFRTLGLLEEELGESSREQKRA
jgi:hydrogenase expression/formation protein HypC